MRGMIPLNKRHFSDKDRIVWKKGLFVLERDYCIDDDNSPRGFGDLIYSGACPTCVHVLSSETEFNAGV